jgi:branched-chain amino acid transport system ATP-binding protein
MLLDEPSAGLSPAMVHEVLEKLTALCHQGSAAVLLVEQNVRVAAKLANRIYHLVDGVARELPTTERLSDEDLLRALGIVRTPLPNACI